MSNYTRRTPKNPNELYKGGRVCAAVGQQKHTDCSGEWTELLGLMNRDPRAPHIAICDYHRFELAGVKPPQPRNKRARVKLDEVPSL